MGVIAVLSMISASLVMTRSLVQIQLTAPFSDKLKTCLLPNNLRCLLLAISFNYLGIKFMCVKFVSYILTLVHDLNINTLNNF